MFGFIWSICIHWCDIIALQAATDCVRGLPHKLRCHLKWKWTVQIHLCCTAAWHRCDVGYELTCKEYPIQLEFSDVSWWKACAHINEMSHAACINSSNSCLKLTATWIARLWKHIIFTIICKNHTLKMSLVQEKIVTACFVVKTHFLYDGIHLSNDRALRNICRFKVILYFIVRQNEAKGTASNRYFYFKHRVARWDKGNSKATYKNVIALSLRWCTLHLYIKTTLPLMCLSFKSEKLYQCNYMSTIVLLTTMVPVKWTTASCC